MIDPLDPNLLLPPTAPERTSSQRTFDDVFARWMVGELTQSLFEEGAPLEEAAFLQSLFQDALADAVAAQHPGLIGDGTAGARHPPPPGRAPVVGSGFGVRTDPFTGARRFHRGVDLPAATGTPVRAVRSGVVRFAGERGSYGQVVIVDHGDGLETRYAHLSRVDVEPGTTVPAGTILGAVGSTGRSTGPHLHFETRQGGRAIDPEDRLPGFAAQVLGELRR